MERRNIIDFLHENFLNFPKKRVFINLKHNCPEESINYEELYSTVENKGSALINKRLFGEVALLVFEDSFEFIIAFLAAQFAGIICVPVYLNKGDKSNHQLETFVEESKAKFILTSSLLRSKIANYSFIDKNKIDIIVFEELICNSRLTRIAKVNNVAFIQYTSGSISNPKGVVITNANLLANQKSLKDTFESENSSILLSWLPFYHDMGLVGNLLHTIYLGCSCIIMSSYDFLQRPQRWLENISKYKVTHSGGPNFAYDLVLKKYKESERIELDLSTWKVAYNGSEMVNADTLTQFSFFFKGSNFSEQSFFTCYGLAEYTLVVTGVKKNPLPIILHVDRQPTKNAKIKIFNYPGKNTKTVVSSGSTVSGTEVKILANNGRQLNELEEGEIFINGDSLFKGYWNLKNDKVFKIINGKKFFGTGDMGFFFQRELFVSGRIKEMFIAQGKNYFPYDIEHAVSKLNASIVPNGVAVFCPDDGQTMIIAVEIKREALRKVNVNNLLSAINSKVSADFKISPYDILLILPGTLPRTSSGKIKRIMCVNSYNNNSFRLIKAHSRLKGLIDDQEGYYALRNEVLKIGNHKNIEAYLIKVLELRIGEGIKSSIDDTTNLFQLGLDSIKSIEFLNTINDDLDINISQNAIFQCKTISALVDIIENLLWLKKTSLSINQVEI